MKKSMVGIGMGLLAAAGVLGYGFSTEKQARRQLATEMHEARQHLEGTQAELRSARATIQALERRAETLEAELNQARALLSAAQERLARPETARRPEPPGPLSLNGRKPAIEPASAPELFGPPAPPAVPRPRPPTALRLAVPQ